MISSEELLSKVPARCDRDGSRADSLFIMPSDLHLLLCYTCTLKHGAELLTQGACVTSLHHADGFKPVIKMNVGERG